ncbi:uncharacterized protein Dwil_GK15158 [Drosophila willistoni]|uniref:Transcriptional coactivator p15 (PC4) C-terminal domain-containing protein n=1 Tax=Drosophila willistoni TaxID=7260 RepID=B4MVX6_DROWI|nr:RNA polymerase II transcriptional coactivator [Drosophila willistoni]EDW75846.1 uncharacterized protein Dwil_GK15158 [Drosophila willistoni]
MPKIKKSRKSTTSDSDSGPEDRNPPPSKKAKEVTTSSAKKDTGGGGDGSTTWTLEKLRQVRINEFRGRKMVDIREHYEKNGEILPGKKGISLSIQQWKKLLELADEITQAVEK